MARYRPPFGTRAAMFALAGAATGVGACGSEIAPPEPGDNRSPLSLDAIANLDVPLGQPARLDVAGHFRDPDGDALAFTATSLDPGVARITASGTSVTVEGVARGTAQVEVTARDDGGLSATQRFEATVGNALALSLGVAQAREGGVARLDVVLGEPTDAPLTVSYRLGVDDHGLTDDADAADILVAGGGQVEIAPGASGATIEIGIADDEDVEPPRELLTLTLERPDARSGFVLASPSSAVIVIREGVCDRTPAVRGGIVRRLRADACSAPDGQALAGIATLALDADEVRVDPKDRGVLGELRAADFSGLSGLEWLSLRGYRLGALPPRIFSDLSSLEVLNLSENELTELPPDVFSGLRRLQWLSVVDNRLEALPAGTFAGLAGLRELYLGDNELSVLPAGAFSGLLSLERLGLGGNRAAFAFPVILERTDSEDPMASGPGTIKARILEGAPFDVRLPLSARGGTLSFDSILVRAGTTTSASVRFTPDDGSDTPISIAVGTEDALSEACADRCDGFDIVAGDPLVVSNPGAVTVSVPVAYVTQATQSREGSVPLVSGRRALLRVFATADEVNGFRPGATATFFRGGVETHRTALEPPAGGIPLEVDESRLGRSFNAAIPGHVLEPGVSMVVELDPEGALPLTASSVTRFPAEGRHALDVRSMPPLGVTLVPVQFLSEANREVNPGVAEFAGELAAAAGGGGSAVARSVLEHARTVLPLGELNVTLREPYYSWADTTEAGIAGLLSEIELLRAMDAAGPDEHYSGIFGVPAPLSRHPDAYWTDGLGQLGGMSSLTASHGEDRLLQRPGRLRLVFAHELGHNLGRPHTPCDEPVTDPGVIDPDFPWADGFIGAWGHDFGAENGPRFGHLFDPEGYKDLMSYCYPQWISDYTFTQMLEFRLTAAAGTGRARAARSQNSVRAADRSTPHGDMLLVWGGVREGELRLEPAFVYGSDARLPSAPGPYRLTGVDEAGRRLFSLRFTPERVDDRTRSFTFALPFDPAWTESLDHLTLSGPEGSVTLGRGRGGRAALILDRATGRVRGMARDMSDALPPALAAEGARLKVVRGLPHDPG